MSERKSVSFFDLFVREKLGAPEGWSGFKFEVINDRQVMVTGAVPIGLIAHGPRKGAPKWPAASKCNSFAIDKAAYAAFELEWEKRTGECHACHGNGTRFFSWSADEGTTYRTCKRCNGSGAAPSAEAEGARR